MNRIREIATIQSAYKTTASSTLTREYEQRHSALNAFSTNDFTYNIFRRVSNVKAFPNKTVCRLKYDNYGAIGVASGVVVGRNQLLTAAHCVMNEEDGDAFFSQWTAYPAYQDNASAYGVSSGWARVYYPSDWKDTHATYSDWCLCILEQPLGDTVDWSICQKYGNPADLVGRMVDTFGYPLSDNGKYQWSSRGKITNANAWMYTADYQGGKGISGGPVCRISDWYVVGIHSRYWGYNDYRCSDYSRDS